MTKRTNPYTALLNDFRQFKLKALYPRRIFMWRYAKENSPAHGSLMICTSARWLRSSWASKFG